VPSATKTDEFIDLPKSDHVWWVEWMSPVDMIGCVGYWAALVPPDDRGRNVLVSTTFGSVQRIRELERIDLSLNRDWPTTTIFSTKAEKEALKARALRALYAAMT
jgi:hypothetical protein